MDNTPIAGGDPGLSRITFDRVFSETNRLLAWPVTSHDVEIRDESGTVLFVQEGVEAPATWSERAVRIAASKYLYGDPARGPNPCRGGRESSILMMHGRVARFLAAKGVEQGVFDQSEADVFYAELISLTLGQYAAFNSPVWFNVGIDSYGVKGTGHGYAWNPGKLQRVASWTDAEGRRISRSAPLGGIDPVEDVYRHPQGSACFIQSVEDNLESIMDLAVKEARLFKYGSGSGTDLSTIRSKRETLTSGGKPSGPLSFMKVYDAVAGVIKSGGKTRRAAKMQTLHCSHPDIFDFIEAKGKEEDKALALIRQGYDANFNGEAYSSVCFQNANLSVRLSDEFMGLYDQDPTMVYWLNAVRSGEGVELVQVGDVMDAIAHATWRCGDPGVQFETTINDWHTCPTSIAGKAQPINSSNPCSEYLFIDDSACNLASLNLMKFRGSIDGRIDVRKLRAAIRIMIVAQEILVDACSYPTREIAQNSHDYRTLGLGFANLGGLLQASGIAYDSDEGRAIAAALAGIIGGESYNVSSELASVIGPFPGYEANREPMLRVIAKHCDAAVALDRDWTRWIGADGEKPLVAQMDELACWSRSCWSAALYMGRRDGFRNAQVTVIAPTGTIAFMMDCDTTGIEPNLALAATKTLAGGGTMPVVNRLVREALDALGYEGNSRELIELYIAHQGTAEGADRLIAGLKPEHLPVFDTSFPPPGCKRTLSYMAHLKMMAAVQPFISGAISKTVNVPHDFTPDQIADCYFQAWKLGLKCCAIYRDGSKGSQPLVAVGGPVEPIEKCNKCGSENVVPAGTCGVCTECGEPTGGCS